jgi:hypothetical protein
VPPSPLHYCVVLLQNTMQAVAVQLFMAAFKFTVCNMYLPPHTDVTLANLQNLLSQLPAPLLLLGDFSVRHHFWGSANEVERGWVIETLISRFNLVVLNMGEPTHISLTFGHLSCLDLTICSPAVSAHLVWILLDGLCRSDHFVISLCVQSSALYKAHNPNWVVKQADWSLFSKLAKIEETSFPTLDSMVDKFTCTVLRVSEQSVPQ